MGFCNAIFGGIGILFILSITDAKAVPTRLHGITTRHQNSHTAPAGVPIYSHDYEIDFGHEEDPIHGHQGSAGKVVLHQHHLGDGKHSHGGDLSSQGHGNKGSNEKVILHNHFGGASFHDHKGNQRPSLSNFWNKRKQAWRNFWDKRKQAWRSSWGKPKQVNSSGSASGDHN